MDTEEYITKLFLDAGWFEGREIQLAGLQDRDSDAHRHALQILKEYGGLSVGKVGPGRECAASDIEFLLRPRYEADRICREWEPSVGNLIAIATAHHGHIIVFVNTEGNLYFFTDPDQQLYCGGSFAEATSRLLLGLSYGSPIEKT